MLQDLLPDQPLGPSLRAVWERDHDPFLDELRWRLHLRLLLISAALSGGFFLRSVAIGGGKELGLGTAVCLLVWALLRHYQALNRWVVRANLAFFCLLALHTLWQQGSERFPSSLLAMMVMPVFGTLLDGIGTGALVLAFALFSGVLWLGHNGQIHPGNTLAVVFCMLSSAGLYLLCVAHTWIFVSLVDQRRQSTLAAESTRNAVGRLATTLTDQIFKLTQRLQMELKVEGLKGLSATTSLSATLKQARLDLPAEIPRNGLLPLDLLQQLRRSALADFLYVALGLSALSLLLMLLIHPPEWQLAALMTVFCALLYRGSRQDPRWHWRVRIFTAVALAACLADVLLSAKDPPAASLVFMPVIIFFVAMLDELWAALLACAAALAVVFVSFWVTGPDISNATVLSTEAMLLPSLIAISAATLPIYGALLGQLSTEEAQLAQSLASYRRLMSTFFHDLANPLSVLQILTTLPPALQVPEDALRAQRMAERMDAVAHAALQTLLGSAPVQAPATLGQLGGELYDLFKERLREKGLQWVLGRGANLPLRQSGPLLRDSVLGNLLSNAIKFSPPGSRIELHGWDAGANIHLQLSDTGRGIPPQVLADLAQGRSPASRSGTQGESGSGFGLLLAKAYLAELGGSLTLRARAGGGTEAELTLPKG